MLSRIARFTRDVKTTPQAFFSSTATTTTTVSKQQGFDGSNYKWNTPTENDIQKRDVVQVFEAGMRHHHTANTAYPIGHSSTLRPYRVPRHRDQAEIRETLAGAYGSLKEMMLYVHIPFCAQRCQFCEYTVVNPKHGKEDDIQNAYFDRLLKEMDMYKNLINTQNKKLAGFDIGGGTPSMASIQNIERVMAKAHDMFKFNEKEDFAISIETTPRIAASEPDKINAYYQMGIRRISMGLQTTDFALSKKLGRQDAGYVDQALNNIRKAGFESFNIDLMYGFPLREGAVDSWPTTVQSTIDLQPEHITLYRMRYKGTKMAGQASRVHLDQVNSQEARARELLEQAGYAGWVGKNTYSRTPGSSGCSEYLERRVVEGIPYIGCGLGAQSFSRHTLAYNLGAVTKKLSQYFLSVDHGRIPIQDLYHLPLSSAIGKMAAVSFYFGGIDRNYFTNCFGISLDSHFREEISFLKENGLMVDDGFRLQMTKKGKKHFGGVVALFYAPAVQQHLIDLPGGDPYSIQYLRTSETTGVFNTLHSDQLSTGHHEDEQETQDGDNADSSSNPPAGDWARTSKDGRKITMSVNGVITSRRLPSSVPSPTLPLQGSSAPFSSPASPSRLISSLAMDKPPKRSYSTCSTSAHKADTVSEMASVDHSKAVYEFGNILFGGPCNQNCSFCIGKQLSPSLSPLNHRLYPPRNFSSFLAAMKQSKTQKVIFTGTTTDPQLYKHEAQLIADLRSEIPNVHISLHTNGMAAPKKMHTFNLYDNSTISINSFNPATFKKLHGVSRMPDVRYILDHSQIPIKLSCVLNEENKLEMEEYLGHCSRLGIKRVALRYLFGQTERYDLFPGVQPSSYFCGNPVYIIDGVEVTHWNFNKSELKSLNLFADGTLSDTYLLSDAVPNKKA